VNDVQLKVAVAKCELRMRSMAFIVGNTPTIFFAAVVKSKPELRRVSQFDFGTMP